MSAEDKQQYQMLADQENEKRMNNNDVSDEKVKRNKEKITKKNKEKEKEQVPEKASEQAPEGRGSDQDFRRCPLYPWIHPRSYL